MLFVLFGFSAPAYANNTFPGTTITGTVGSTNGSTVGATGQTGEPTTYGGGSLNTIWYNWTAASSGTVTFQTCGGSTNFDTTLAAFTGGTVSTLTNVATNDDSCSTQSLISFNAVAGTSYRIQVDGYGSATGNFTLSWSQTVASGSADLSLTQSVSTSTPQSGARVDYTLTVTNSSASAATATGIQVSNVLNTALVYRSQSGTGTYDSATGIWSVGSLAPGASASIVITVANNAVPGTTIANYAQITASSATDPDSSVNNNSTTEDDDDSVSITVANFPPAGTAPTLTCPVTSGLFDWDAQSWTNGALSGSFNVTNIGPMALNFTGNTNRLIADPSTSSATPARNTSSTGGATGQNSLMLVIDLASTSESVNATWTFTNGVAGLQFTLADIDLFYGQFEDRITVTGSYKGVAVTPVLTNFGANSVSGNTATATALADNTTANGNVRVTFLSPVDTVTINYGATATAPTDPGVQAIALMDMTACTAATDLALAKTVSNSNPNAGAAISYTLTATNTTANAMDTTGVAVSDVLPAGFSFVSASGTGTYNSSTGVWSIGNLARGATATLTINGTVSASAGTTVTNTAQITASSLADPDSTVNNSVTTEDDYASVAFTVPSIINCPTGSTSTGSGFATGGTGAYQNQIFWLDWTCGGVTNYPAGSTINKSWDAGDGLVITGQVTNITFPMTPYTTGAWGGDLLDDLYPGVNPIGLRGVNDGEDPQFRVVYTATLNGVAVPLNYAVADAESTDFATEGLAGTTNATNWALLEQSGALDVTLAGNSFTMSDVGNAGNGSAIVYTTGSTVQIDATITQGGLQAMAFGVWAPFDYSDAPLTGTSYGSANHRTIGNYILGASVTSEAAAYDTPAANGDVDNGLVTMPGFLLGQTATVNVSVQGLGYLSGWIDFNDDGDWADAGEKIATDLRDGGAGDLDGTINGNIQFQVSVPVAAALTPTIARLRYSSRTGAPTTGLWGFGEVEDYQITIQTAELTLSKTSTVVSDPVNGTVRPKAIPGATVRYCILVTNTGTASANNVQSADTLPSSVTYIPGTISTGATCASATNAEDDDASGGDESDPFGGSLSTTATDYIINGSAPSLAPGATFAVVFDVLMEPSPYPEAF